MKVLKNNRQAVSDMRRRAGWQLNKVIVKRQKQFADYLNRKTQHWNKASKYLFLFLLCLLLGAISLSLIIKAFYQ